MKRILTAAALMLLVVCMIFVLGSCGGVSADKAKDDPQAVIADALELGTAEFFSLNADADKVIEEAIKSGAITLSLEESDLLEDAFGISGTELKAIIYSNTKDDKYAVELDSKIADEDLTGIVFIDKDKIVLQSKSLLGTKDAYSFSPSTFIDKYDKSDLKDMLDLDSDSEDQLIEAMETLKDAYAKLFDLESKENKELNRKFFEALKYEVTEEKVDGVNSVVITLTLNNDTLADYMDVFVEATGLKGELKEEFEEELVDAIEDITDTVKLDCKVSIAINKDNGKLYNITADMKVSPTDKSIKQSVSVKVDFDISDTNLALAVDVVADLEEKQEFEFKLTGEKTVKGDDVTLDFKLTAKGDFGYEEINDTIATATFEYDQKKGDFELTVKGNEELADFEASIEGNLKVDGNKATLVIEEAGANGVSVDIGLKVEFEKGVKAPETPKATDIIELSEDDFEDLANDIEEKSIFAKMYY